MGFTKLRADDGTDRWCVDLGEKLLIVGSVDVPPRVRFSDDLTAEQLKQHLPLVHCRGCGAMGWATWSSPTAALLEPPRREVGGLLGLTEPLLRAMLLGALHRLRERDGIFHHGTSEASLLVGGLPPRAT